MSFGDFAIAPSTTVTLCAGVPLAKGSEDTILFSSAGEQASIISSHHIATFSNITYQRNTRNVVRIGMPMGVSGANSAIRANYLIFNNTAFEGKNIYAFVDSVDYVNNNTVDVTFTIDAMQTFMFDYQLRECFVEREHSVTDDVGDNVVPENFGELPVVINSKNESCLFRGATSTGHFYTDKYIYVVYSVPQETDDVHGDIVNNVYVATTVQEQILAGAQGVDSVINTARHRHETIVAVVAVPTDVVASGRSGYEKHVTIPINTIIGESGWAYTPKNKKLLTYPYNYIVVSNNNGEDKQIRWEWFNNPGNATFTLYAAYMPTPEAALVPENYRGTGRDYGDACFFNGFPSSAWSEDSFLSWQLRNRNSYDASVSALKWKGGASVVSGTMAGAAVGSAFGPVGTAVGALVGGAGSFISTASNAAQLAGSVQDQKAAPDQLTGNAAASVVNEILDCTGFTIYGMSVPVRYASMIDDYFTMYGYATNRVKQPNISSRPRFNYVKTQGCTIYGSVPAPFAAEIQSRFNNGVRFWRPGATIGDYTTSNAPT